MPIVEAMAAGCPVIATRAASMLEVAGDAAILLDEPNADSIAEALRTLFNAAVRARYVEIGRRQAARFSWERTAKETISVYDSLK